MKRRVFLKTAGSVAALSGLSPMATAFAGQEAESTPTFHRVLTCNIRLPQPQDAEAGDGWPERRQLCADVIRSQHPDIICLQESELEQLEFLKSQLRGFESHGLTNPHIAFRPQNSILYSTARYALLSAGGFWLSETPHVAGSSSWDSARPRFANWIDLKERATGTELRVWNTHLDHKGQVAREQQARMLLEACQPFPDLPQVLAGDFNADTRNPAIVLLREGGWGDTYTSIHGPEDPGFTYHAFIGPKRAERITPKNPGKIDWIFTRNVKRVLAAEIIYDQRDGRYPSDHYFVSADIVLGKEGE